MLKFARSFCVLAEELHFGRAAARLHVTQPALSHQIKALEREVGCAVLRRSPQHVVLTEAGAVLARGLGVALEQTERALREAVEIARGDAGLLAIGYCASTQTGGLASLLQRFSSQYPRVDIILRNLPTDAQEAALLSGAIDIGFLHPPLEATQLVLRPAGTERMVAVFPAGHPLLARKHLALADLAPERLIFCSAASAPHMHHAVQTACGRAGFQPRFRPAEDTWHSMADQAAAGLGVALLPESMAAAAGPHLAFRVLDGLDLRLQVAIATKTGKLRPGVERFLATGSLPS